MELLKTHNFLGTGWSFPPVFDNKTAEVTMTQGVEDINRSIEIILTTKLGERKLYPKFGCGMDDYLFRSLDTATLTLMENSIRTALLYHEARIDVEDILFNLNNGSGLLEIDIQYKLRNANSRFNYVFPFYLNEANNPI